MKSLKKYDIYESLSGSCIISGIYLNEKLVEKLSSETEEGHFNSHRVTDLRKDLGERIVFALPSDVITN